MHPTLPSLKALRAFEAAARLKSFKDAGEELCVTPAAISQQIKMLEEQLGRDLFERNHRSLELTEAAKLIFPEVRNAFELLRDAVQRLHRSDERYVLKIACAPAFATKWLIPQLRQFSTATLGYDTDVFVVAAHELIDYERNHIDIGIRYGSGLYPGLTSERLFVDALCAVYAPGKLAGRKHALELQDISKHALIHDDSMAFDDSFPNWAVWLDKFGLHDIDCTVGPRFNIATDAITAALQGAGILLARRSLIQNELTSGDLVRVGDTELPIEHSFYVVHKKEKLERPEVLLFRNWLVDELVGGRLKGGQAIA